MADIANPDLFACGSRTWISLHIEEKRADKENQERIGNTNGFYCIIFNISMDKNCMIINMINDCNAITFALEDGYAFNVADTLNIK